MDADAEGDPHGSVRRRAGHPGLDLARGLGRLIGRCEDEHRLVADRLDEAPAVAPCDIFGKGQATPNRGERLGIPRLLIQARAARDVGEEHGQIPLGGLVLRGNRRIHPDSISNG